MDSKMWLILLATVEVLGCNQNYLSKFFVFFIKQALVILNDKIQGILYFITKSSLLLNSKHEFCLYKMTFLSYGHISR